MKKIILITALVCTIMCTVCGCGDNSEVITNDGRSITAIDLVSQEGLVYDTATEIVYISQSTYGGAKIYTPYFSENGLLYRYIKGELVEVEYQIDGEDL